jgi:hypothetical protein
VRVNLPVPRPIERNSWPLVAQTGAVEIADEVSPEVVVARHRVTLAALLTQQHPEPAVLCKDSLDRHAERRANPRAKE